MKSSECVVAINRDQRAEIFKIADLKVLADLETLMPELLQRLEARIAR
jgi:electron transfer flavoprotein alpha subunit